MLVLVHIRTLRACCVRELRVRAFCGHCTLQQQRAGPASTVHTSTLPRGGQPQRRTRHGATRRDHGPRPPRGALLTKYEVLSSLFCQQKGGPYSTSATADRYGKVCNMAPWSASMLLQRVFLPQCTLLFVPGSPNTTTAVPRTPTSARLRRRDSWQSQGFGTARGRCRPMLRVTPRHISDTCSRAHTHRAAFVSASPV
jgi:hypothetical protein